MKTPAQMVEDILAQGPYDWHAPIARYVDPVLYDEVRDWQAEHLRLLKHHTLEVDTLLAVIREMRRRLKP